ncbi:MAG TPA: hypothetical protein VI455_06735 [Terriglobia bacterium]
MASPYPEGALEEAQAALQRARTADQLRRAQCVWMRLSLGMNAFQIAKAMGWSVWSVRGVQSLYRRKGARALEGPGRGGRRYEVLTRDAEADLLNRLRAEAWPNAVLEFRDIHQAVELAAGRPVAPSTVHRMLTRHGWGRRSLVGISRRGGASDARFDARHRSGTYPLGPTPPQPA